MASSGQFVRRLLGDVTGQRAERLAEGITELFQPLVADWWSSRPRRLVLADRPVSASFAALSFGGH